MTIGRLTRPLASALRRTKRPGKPETLESHEDSARMRSDWDDRARENARWYIASDVSDDEEFTASGRHDVEMALRGLAPDWLSRSRALEIGCGAGRMTEFLLPRVGALTAVDVSPQMIELAGQRLGSRPGLRLGVVSGSDLADFSDGAFDFVFSYVVLQHIPKRIVRTYIDEFRRVLAPNGIARLQFARLSNPEYVPPSDEDTFTMRSWTDAELRECFAGWGSLDLDAREVVPMTEHIWVTAGGIA